MTFPMTIMPPAQVEEEVLERTNGHPPKNGHGRGNGRGRGLGGGPGGGQGGADGGGEGSDPSPQSGRRRRSYWPFLLDLGLVLALFGLIITGRPLMVIGAIIFVVALAGWIREARADYSNLSE
jgi:hypothetical protein